MNNQVKNLTENPLSENLVKVDKSTAIKLQETFNPFFEKAQEWKKEAEAIVVTSSEQTEDMALAREIRLELKHIRTETEKKRKAMKEESLRTGKAIDGIANVIKFLIVPIEEYLQEQEDYVKREKERKKIELTEKRIAELSQYEVETEHYNLSDMSEAGYNQLLETSKIIFEQKREAERKAEEERIAREKAEAEENERIRKENERLKKEAEERERQAKIERKKQEEAKRIEQEKREKEETARKIKEEKERKAHEEKIKKEREAREKVERELKAKKEAEEKAKRDREEQERQAKLAPDKKKLESLAVRIMEIELPDVTSSGAKKILESAVELLNKTSNYIKQKSIDL